MRTKKELFELMLDNKDLFKLSMCSWSYRLHTHSLINDAEYILLLKHIEENRPSKYSSINAFRSRNTWFYWPPEKINPRIKWIKKQIEKL